MTNCEAEVGCDERAKAGWTAIMKLRAVVYEKLWNLTNVSLVEVQDKSILVFQMIFEFEWALLPFSEPIIPEAVSHINQLAA